MLLPPIECATLVTISPPAIRILAVSLEICIPSSSVVREPIACGNGAARGLDLLDGASAQPEIAPAFGPLAAILLDKLRVGGCTCLAASNGHLVRGLPGWATPQRFACSNSARTSTACDTTTSRGTNLFTPFLGLIKIVSPAISGSITAEVRIGMCRKCGLA